MKALYRRHRRAGSRGSAEAFPPTVDKIHRSHNEEEADKTDEYGACGKGISAREEPRCQVDRHTPGTTQFNFCMRKSLILYCINLLRYCPDPGSTGDMPCNTGTSGLSPLSSALKRFPVGLVPLPGSMDEGIPLRKRQAVSCKNSTFSQGRFNNLSTGLFACVTYFF